MTTAHTVVYMPTSDFYLPVGLRFTAGVGFAGPRKKGKGKGYS